jgi:capsular exopolysaccharide synthesis family protein
MMRRSFTPVPRFTRPADATALAEPILLDAPYDAFADDEPHILMYWSTLRRGWPQIVATATLCVLATAAYVLTRTPLYGAAATVLIERQNQHVLDVRELVADGLSGDEANYYRTQHEILRSRALAVAVIRDLDLEHDPAFTQRDDRPGLLAGAVVALRARLRSVLGSPPPDVAERRTLGVSAALLDRYLANLSVDPITRTRLALIRFTSPSPDLASRIVNAHVDAYVQQGLRLRSQAGEKARQFLEAKLVELKEHLEESELSLNAYRREKGILSLDEKENIVVERLSDLNRLVSKAEARRIGLEAEAKLIENRDFGSLPAVAASTLIQALKRQLTDAQRAYVELSAQFTPAYPAVQRAQAEVRQIQERLGMETRQVAAAIESQYMAAIDEENQLRARLDEQKTATLAFKDTAVQYAMLKRETDANRDLYDSILQRMKEIGVAATVQASNVSIVDAATPPRYPSSPHKARALGLALLAGFVLGIGVVLGRDYLDSSLKSPEEVERYLGLPSLGIVPDFRGLAGPADVLAPTTDDRGSDEGPDAAHPGGAPDTSLVPARDSFSVVTESYRTLRTALIFSRPEAAPQTMLFTSAMEGEGKTTTALNTAIVYAKLGARVLVIDADLRRANCHRRLGVPPGRGLSAVLTGQYDLDQVVRPTAIPRVFLLRAGELPPNPTELLASNVMAALLTEAAGKFDYVIVDSPPVMAVNDAVVLSPLVEGVVIVVKAHSTPRQILQRAENRLAQARACVLGVVLNQLDARSDNYATYYGGSYYSSYCQRGSQPESV